MLIFSCLCVVEGLAYTFIFCYFATVATTAMASISSTVQESNWYLQPLPIQKKYILIIARSQIPAVFTGLKMVRCSLESFTMVIFSIIVMFLKVLLESNNSCFFQLTKTATTYYVMFRNLSSR